MILPLRLRVTRCAADMRYFPILLPFRQTNRDMARSIVTEQTPLVTHDSLVAAGCRQNVLDRGGDVLSPHVCAKLPCDDVAAVVIKDRAEYYQPQL